MPALESPRRDTQDSASLADVVVGVSLKAIVDALVDDKVMSGYPSVQAYVKRWSETGLHSKAASKLAEIRKVRVD